MDELIHNISSEGDVFIPFIIFATGGVIAVVAIVFGAIKRISINSEREKSRRDIAAYIAEGSMTSEDGIKLLKAAPSDKNLDQA